MAVTISSCFIYTTFMTKRKSNKYFKIKKNIHKGRRLRIGRQWHRGEMGIFCINGYLLWKWYNKRRENMLKIAD